MFTIIDAYIILSVTIIVTTPIYLILWFLYKKYNLYESSFIQAGKVLITSAINLRIQNISNQQYQREVIMDGITSVVNCFDNKKSKKNINNIKWITDIVDILINSLESRDFNKSTNALYKVFNVLSDGQI